MALKTFNPLSYEQITGDDFSGITAKVPNENQFLSDRSRFKKDAIKSAKDYRQNLTSNVEKQSDLAFQPIQAQAKRQLAQNIKDTRNDFNRRGLLHSGARASAEVGNQANMVTALNDYRSKLNQALYGNAMNTANTLENNAINMDYLKAGIAPQLGNTYTDQYQNILNQDINSANATSGLMGNIASGAASGIGYYAGRKRS